MSNKIVIRVGSNNPVKVAAAKQAIACFYPGTEVDCQGMHAPSGVAEQPMTTAETKLGAINRAKYCQQTSQADFYVAMEGGVDHFDHGYATFAYVAILKGEQLSVGRSAELPLPAQVYQALEAGEELGNVMDKLFNTENIKQKGGAIGLLTHHQATRESSYTQALILAMAPLLNPELYITADVEGN
ncbi:inosine/xanthosine triphosphatase [Shewanella gelidii]|nr:inosine/xanthosine triphosphatase [Shewanella gelidii]MCL1097790.1 inosine/xanthosine triphosphatase [Shewanella gelidii]